MTVGSFEMQGQECGLHRSRSALQCIGKRVFDICVATIGLIFLSPVLLSLFVLVRIQDGGPALFAHSRVGKNGKIFRCYKFRSMVVDAQQKLDTLLASDPAAADEWARDQKLRKDPRVTALGRFIRKSSLDELPQLLNILKGEMSVVGPRPIIQDELARYGDYDLDYLSVTPGVTGLWQVSGRNDVSYDERVQMDVAYARSWTVLGDVWITLKTFPAVLLSRGAS